MMAAAEPISIDEAERLVRGGQVIVATPFTWIEPEAIPPRRWIYGRHLIRQFLSVTVAPGGMGKSSLAIAEALALVTGRSILGDRVHEKVKVWLWNLEDPFEELQRRIIATCQHYEIAASEIAGRLFVDSGRDMPLVIVTETRDGVLVAEPIIEAIIKAITRNRIDVLIIDPFVLTHRVNENSNGAIDLAARQWGRVADQTHSAIDLVHHVRKGAAGQGEFTVEDGRGASALLAAARSARVLNRMTEAEGARAGVENHRHYFRIDNGKSNLAPPADQTAWRRLISHQLPNGDNVGVVTEWSWPDPLAGMSVSDLIAVQTEITGKGYRHNVQAGNWIGKPIAEILQLDLGNKQDLERVKSVIATWIKTGALKIIETKDEKGKARPTIEVGEWANS